LVDADTRANGTEGREVRERFAFLAFFCSNTPRSWPQENAARHRRNHTNGLPHGFENTTDETLRISSPIRGFLESAGTKFLQADKIYRDGSTKAAELTEDGFLYL
jgi:hypothetical protein